MMELYAKKCTDYTSYIVCNFFGFIVLAVDRKECFLHSSLRKI